MRINRLVIFSLMLFIANGMRSTPCLLSSTAIVHTDSLFHSDSSLKKHMLDENATEHTDNFFCQLALEIDTITPDDRTVDDFTITDTTVVKTLNSGGNKNANRLIAISDSLIEKAPKLYKPFIPNPQRALWLSLVIPGGGQIYNRKYWKLPIVYGGFVGCAYAMSWNNQVYKDYSQAYLDLIDNDPNTASYINLLPINYDVAANEERLKTLFRRRKDYFRRYRDLSFFSIIGVYILSVIDAYVDAELSVFDISRDLSIKFEPTIMNNGARWSNNSLGLQCVLNF